MPDSQSIVRTLIVDDEPYARRHLRELLTGEKEVKIVGEAASGAEAVNQIRDLSPDLVFLDIKLPQLDAFGVIRKIGVAKMPAFIFTTAYSDFAVRAFEVKALDYLCKPFGRERLLRSLHRALHHLQTQEQEPERSEDEGKTQPHWLSHVSIKDENEILFVPVEEILWIDAANKYVVIHTKERTYIARQTMQSLEEALDPNEFIRIHRSVLVRKTAVRGLRPIFHGDYTVKLTTGVELTLTRNFRELFFKKMSR